MNFVLARKDSSLTLSIGGINLQFEEVEHDSRLLGKQVFHLTSWERFGTFSRPPIPLPLTDLWKEMQGALLTARVPASDIELREAMNMIGFKFVELTLHPKMNIEAQPTLFERHLEMREALPGEVANLAEEARTAFKVSRFFTDMQIADDKAAERFYVWVRDSYTLPNKRIWVFEDSQGDPVAFFLDRVDGSYRFLELTAMLKESRGRGLARKVWETYLHAMQEEGVQMVHTNISAENSAVVALYPKLGFQLDQPSIALHLHVLTRGTHAAGSGSSR